MNSKNKIKIKKMNLKMLMTIKMILTKNKKIKKNKKQKIYKLI